MDPIIKSDFLISNHNGLVTRHGDKVCKRFRLSSKNFVGVLLEAAFASQLNHANIVHATRVWLEVDGISKLWLVIEFPAMGRVEYGMKLPEIVTLGLDVLSALEYLHRNGVSHGDVKPYNMLRQNGVTMLADLADVNCVLKKSDGSTGTPSYYLKPPIHSKIVEDLIALRVSIAELVYSSQARVIPEMHAGDFEPLEGNEVIKRLTDIKAEDLTLENMRAALGKHNKCDSDLSDEWVFKMMKDAAEATFSMASVVFSMNNAPDCKFVRVARTVTSHVCTLEATRDTRQCVAMAFFCHAKHKLLQDSKQLSVVAKRLRGKRSGYWDTTFDLLLEEATFAQVIHHVWDQERLLLCWHIVSRPAKMKLLTYLTDASCKDNSLSQFRTRILKLL